MVRSVFAALIAALAAGPSPASDLVILIHPKSNLDPTKVPKVDEGTDEPFKVLTAARPEAVAGESVKAVKGGDTYILEFLPARVVPQTKVSTGLMDVKGATGSVSYLYVTAYQPFRVWYRKGEGDEAQLLGRSEVWGVDAQLKPIPGTRRYTLDTRKAPELAKGAAVEAMTNFKAASIRDALATGIIVGTPVQNVTPDGQQNHGWSFKPAKVSAERDGTVVIETSLHNRLPFHATGRLWRSAGNAEWKLWEANKAAQPMKDAGLRHLEFDLAPGEKKTVQFRVPRPFALAVDAHKNDRIGVEEVKLAAPKP